MTTYLLKFYVIAALLLILPPLICAQQAPTGDHYGGRTSDTGAGGSQISDAGGFTSYVPLSFPPERAGLPVPVQIVYTARGVGVAGLGWDIPFSYIRHDQTFAHRRPVYGGNYAPPAPRERAYVSLLGTGGELIRDGDRWILRNGTLELFVRQVGDDFVAYDGARRSYTFRQPAELRGGGLWLLKSVSAAGGASVLLSYQITTWPLQGATGLEVSLRRITYNTSPLTHCAKNEITLTYGNGVIAPLSISMLGDIALIRRHTLTQVDVQSRATCATPLQRLRRYEFQYVADADNQLPRLSSVRMSGRQGTAEEAKSLPVATYHYGQTTDHGVLKYEETQSIKLPADDTFVATGDSANAVAGTVVDSSVNAPGSGERSVMWHGLVDIDGDGRPDLVYKKNDQLSVALNRPAAAGATSLSSLVVPLQDATFSGGPLSIHTSSARRLWYGTANRNTVDVWRQAIDINGDGRTDVIDAGQEPEHWIVYLNTPDGPNGIKWERRSLSVHNLALSLVSGGHEIEDGYVPLSRRTTGVSVNVNVCMRSDGSKWVAGYDGPIVIDTGPNLPNPPHIPFTVHCDHGNPVNMPNQPQPDCFQDDMCAPPVGIEPEKSFVEWEVRDLNGDGYPDLVFNSAPANFALATPAMRSTPDEAGHAKIVTVPNHFELPPQNKVLAAFNIVGVHIDAVESNPFSRYVSLHAPHPEFGVGMWEGAELPNLDQSTTQHEIAGLADINGDGLVDRVVGNVVSLGTFTTHAGTVHGFSSVVLRLPDVIEDAGQTRPGSLSGQVSYQTQQCKTQDRFTSATIEGIRDLNGDGFPDYVSPGKVAMGTGAGFAPAIEAVGISLSGEIESCHGEWSYTRGGLFDIDGDGKPDVIALRADSAGNRIADVSQISGGASIRAPEAGRLLAVDNGYGATTHITYRSAKEDLFSSHMVPFPEIVVTAIETDGAQGLGGALLGSRFAYGNAQRIFDAAGDAFAFPGYGRTVEVRLYKGQRDVLEGAATIVDTWPLTPTFNGGMTQAERWLRERRVGHPQDILTLRGSSTTDPWELLHVGANDFRIIGVRHIDWGAKLFELPANTSGAGNLHECVEMAKPYDFSLSASFAFGANGLNPCLAHGFPYASATDSWYGGSPPPSANNVQMRSKVLAVDDFGQITLLRNDNDVFRDDDDLCTEKHFATPTTQFPRTVSSLATLQFTDCDKQTILASESFAYDQLPAGSVAQGRLTSHTVDRRATDDGSILRSVHSFDATYDSAGNVASIRIDHDGVVRSLTYTYEPFGVAPLRTKVSAVGMPSMIARALRDPVSLEAIRITDRNQLQRGFEYDGFGRPIIQTVALPNAAAGVISTMRYDGFDEADALGRRVTITQYPDPISPATLSNATGRTATTFLDELGRVRRAEVSLGSDYSNDSIVVDDRIYDLAGRLRFVADPYAKSQASASHFGTNYFYKRTGDVDCLLRGTGELPLTRLTDAANDRYATCFEQSFDNHLMIADMLDTKTLESSDPQEWVRHRVVSSAAGRELERSKIRAGKRLDFVTYGYDRLGQAISMSRFQEPALAQDPVTWSRRLDSLGNTLRLNQPASSVRYFEYDDWGHLTDTFWKDGAVERRLSRRFDAFGRLSSSQELNNGTPDPETIRAFSYDFPASMSPMVVPTNLLGRLAGATWPTGKMALSYGPLGHVNAEVYEDEEGIYIDEFSRHANGALATLSFRLPDHGFLPENINYEYDSAGNLRTINSVDDSGASTLYRADTIDVLGRVRKATYGTSTALSMDYSEAGRRLLQEVDVDTPSASRHMKFEALDSLDRETKRQESTDNATPSLSTQYWYNDLGQLASVQEHGSSSEAWKFVYDGLGNVTSLQNSSNSKDASISYRTDDRDRICRVEYASHLSSQQCNVEYDGSGAITHEPTRTAPREISYFGSGAVRSISQGGSTARFAYNAFGRLQKLDLQSGAATDRRRDREYGGLIARRDVVTGASTTSQILRTIPGHAGVVATRRGPGDEWVFGFGESRGNRLTTNDAGGVLQDIDYLPFGESSSSGAQPTSAEYTSHQWNGGDALAAFGLSHLGARVYDPEVGRFLSRDPFMTGRGGNASNPYAFAMNDPINAADPSGLDCYPNYGPECQGMDFPSDFANFGNLPEQGQPGAPQSSAPQLIDLGAGFQVDEETGAFQPLAGPSLRITSAWSRRGFDPVYWLRRSQNTFGIPNGENPFEANQAAYDYENTQVVPACGAPINCALAGVDDPDSGLPPINTVMAIFMSGVGGIEEGGAGALESSFDTTGSSSADAIEGALGEEGGELSGKACVGANCGCFVADTPVATAKGKVPIQNLRPGDRVIAGSQQCAAEHLSPDSITIEVDLPKASPSKDVIHATLIRPRPWLLEHEFHDGKVWLDLPELSLSGWASVKGIEPAPAEKSGEGCLVLTTMNHVADRIVHLKVEGGANLELTPTHPLYVEGRGWTAARDLTAGQSLRSDRGSRRVESIAPAGSNQRVYNIEVATEHSYRVANDGIWAHNSCTNFIDMEGNPYRFRAPLREHFEALNEEIRAMEKAGAIRGGRLNPVTHSWERFTTEADYSLPQHFEVLMDEAGSLAERGLLESDALVRFDYVRILTDPAFKSTIGR